jgi:DNA-binding NarL/FixJ family response regulator
MAQGRSNSSIARDLGISDKAVVRHTNRIYGGLGLALSQDEHRRVLAVIRYLAQRETLLSDFPARVAWAGQPACPGLAT